MRSVNTFIIFVLRFLNKNSLTMTDQKGEDYEEKQMPFTLTEITNAVKESPMVIEMGIPEDIISLISIYPLEDMALKLDRSMVEIATADDWDKEYPMDHLFVKGKKGVYCTKKGQPQVEILIKLSTKLHHNEEQKLYDLANANNSMDSKGFIIKKVGIHVPGFGYSRPVKTFIMWVFNEKPPNQQQIKDDYGANIDIQKLKQSKINDDDINDMEGKCVLVLDDLNKGDKKGIDLLQNGYWIKAKYVLIKFMADRQDTNVDIKRFKLRVFRL